VLKEIAIALVLFLISLISKRKFLHFAPKTSFSIIMVDDQCEKGLSHMFIKKKNDQCILDIINEK